LGEEGDHRNAEETADEVPGEQAGGIGEPGEAGQDALCTEEEWAAAETEDGADTDRACADHECAWISLGAVKCAAGAAFSPAGGAVILRTLAHVRVGDAALQADTAVLRALRKDTLCRRRRAADARSVNPRNPL
jgi:hypothetical protein